MFKENLYLKLTDGSEREIASSELISIQPWFAITPIEIGKGMSIAGSGQEYFLVKTKTEELKVPRYPDFPENDKEILDFIFANSEIRKKPDFPA